MVIEDLRAAPPAVWDRAGMMRAVRRRLDLSQRELAARLGVAASTVCAAEDPRSRIGLSTVVEILALAGLRLEVVDTATGQRLEPEPAQVLRDRAGRRFPAHLDARPAGPFDVPWAQWHRRPHPVVTFEHRAGRDIRRARAGAVARWHALPADVERARRARCWVWPLTDEVLRAEAERRARHRPALRRLEIRAETCDDFDPELRSVDPAADADWFRYWRGDGWDPDVGPAGHGPVA